MNLTVSKPTPSWDERIQLIATLITPGSSVLGIGADAQTLERYLSPGCRYTAMDVVGTSERSVPVDFNAHQIPGISHVHDWAVCSGVLEQVVPVDLFLATIAGWARTVVLSYATLDLNPDVANRQRNGWRNHWSDSDLRAMFARHGLTLRNVLSWKRQHIYVLDGSPAAGAIFSTPQQAKKRPDLLSIFRCDATNAGDYFSAPFRYLDLGTNRCADIVQVKDPAALPPRLIIGGGGLLGSPSFAPHFQRLFSRQYEEVIGWGLGDNAQIDVAAGYVERIECAYPSYVDRFDLLGVRDYGNSHRWVPCASCLHPLLDQKWPIEQDVVVYEHKRVPIAINCFPKMSNDTNDLGRVLRFLGTARVVITNSYHGAYWSQLLGKGVLAFPFSTKFYHLKHKVTLCKPAEWRKHLDRAEEQPPALDDCRRANRAFGEEVQNRLDGPRKTPTTPIDRI